MESLSVEDVLLIAEAVLGVPAERLAPATRLGALAAALGAPDGQPGLADRAATLCSRLVRTRPLPDGNTRVALLAMLELVARNHGVWLPPPGGQEEIAATIARRAAGGLSEEAFIAWVRARVTPAGRSSGRSDV